MIRDRLQDGPDAARSEIARRYCEFVDLFAKGATS